MMDGDYKLGRDGTNRRVESVSFIDRSSVENIVDSASVHVIVPSDKSKVTQDVESVGGSVAEGSIDSVSGKGNVNLVHNRRAVDSSESSDLVSHDKEGFSDWKHRSVRKVKSEQQKGHRKKEKKLKESGSPGPKFEVGDMIWAKVKSHPWWPGHVYSEKFATPAVRRSKRDGLLLVAFFGDSSYGWFDRSELIPFDVNFAEKSRQTHSRTFVKAVEEAIDEVSRRSALGLACKCRNKQNFQETNVQGYFSVDVPDYEAGAVYSIDAIQKARDGFQPSSALHFVRRLALEPTGSEHVGIDFIKNKANVIAYRKAIYEEKDETYAQAFGYQSDQTSRSVQDHGRTPSKAPLSGRQVFADTSGKGKSSAKPNKLKDLVKKDKYILKRRDEPKEIKAPKIENPKATFSPQLDENENFISIPAGEYVLQKRVTATKEQVETKADTDSKNATETGFGLEAMPILSEIGESPTVIKFADDGDEKKPVQQVGDKKVLSHQDIPNSEPHKTTDNGPKKVKAAKRPIVETGPGKFFLPEKKKKKIKKESDDTQKEEVSARKPVQSTQVLNLNPPTEEPSGTNTKPYESEIPQMLGDLHSLALDPFPAISKTTVKARQVFLRFRSAVFQKSLNSPLMEDDGNNPRSSKSPAAIPATTGPDNSVKPQAGDDPAQSVRKRVPSDRQEEMAEKKKKKVGDIRILTKEKKVIKKTDDAPALTARDVKHRKPGPELKHSGHPGQSGQRMTEPTMLNIKFPVGASLPSINELKARFARYGPLDHSATRVFWNTFTCRVVYRNKAHAVAAYKFVTGTPGLFGNSDIKCSLKEYGVVGSSNSEPPVKVKEDPEDRPPLKSCLKKSGEDAGGKISRVKFMLGGDESGASFSSTSNATMDFNSKNGSSTSVVSSTSTSTTQLTRLPPQNFMHHGTTVAPPLPPLLPPRPLETKPQHPGNFVHNVQRPKTDISQQMLSLMTKCNEVVSSVTNMLGYVPYHPL